MTRIIYIEHGGAQHEVEGGDGRSVMEMALEHMVPGIVGGCGGNGACATCHGYIDPAWADRMPPISEDEKLMLEELPGSSTNSRLTCQITVNPNLDGLIVRLPESQF